MKQYIYLFIGAMALFFSGFQTANAQCTPDGDFDPEDIISPLPETEEFPDGGIQDTACVNEPYQTTLSFVAPDTVPTVLGPLVVDSIVVQENGVEGLPDGLTFNCNPGSCTFLPLEVGCIGIEGTPAMGMEGIYSLTITVDIYGNGIAFPLAQSLPDDDLAPGEYNLHVREEGNSACQPSRVQEGTSAGVRLTMAPNPAAAYTDLIVNSIGAQFAQVRLFDATGRLFRTAEWQLVSGENRYRLETNDLPVGLYTAVIMTGAREGASLRLLVQR